MNKQDNFITTQEKGQAMHSSFEFTQMLALEDKNVKAAILMMLNTPKGNILIMKKQIGNPGRKIKIRITNWKFYK